MLKVIVLGIVLIYCPLLIEGQCNPFPSVDAVFATSYVCANPPFTYSGDATRVKVGATLNSCPTTYREEGYNLNFQPQAGDVLEYSLWWVQLTRIAYLTWGIHQTEIS